MALLGFFHASSLFVSYMQVNWQGQENEPSERESPHGGGTREDRSTKNLWSCPGFEPQPPVWQASALSIALCPLGSTNKLAGL